MGATKSPIAMIEGTSTACIAFLYSSICPRIESSRERGSGSPTGRSTKTQETALFRVPRWLSARTDTGTIVRTTSFSDVSSPRPCRRSRKPAVIEVRTTSLTVPPSAVRTSLSSAKSVEVHAQRRCGPIGPLRERAVGTSACLARDGSVEATVLPESRTCLASRPAAPLPGIEVSCRKGCATASATAPATMPALVGVRCGDQSRGSSWVASGERSNISCMRSVPATPSTMQWWTLEMIAQRSSARPSIR